MQVLEALLSLTCRKTHASAKLWAAARLRRSQDSLSLNLSLSLSLSLSLPLLSL